MTSTRRLQLVALAMWCALGAASSAYAQDLYYLRLGSLLSLEPPPSGASTAMLSSAIAVGENRLLGTFTSAPFDHDATVSDVRAVVYLGTGRPGMDGCAHVTTALARVSSTGQTAVASGTLVTSILPRKKVTEPVVVQMTISGSILAALGDRLVLDVRVANMCNGSRTVSLLYDSVGRASRVEVLAIGVTTTTTTTTSTTTTLPPTCFETTTGLGLVRCRLEAMDGIIRATSPANLGGVRFRSRFERRVDRALALIRAAERRSATPRRLKRARRQLLRFTFQLTKGLGDGRVESTVGASLASLADGATAGIEALLPAP